MSKDIEVVLNWSGVRELLSSDWAMSICTEQAERMAKSAGSGHGISTYRGRNRVNVSVETKNQSAYKKNLSDNTLLKAMGDKS